MKLPWYWAPAAELAPALSLAQKGVSVILTYGDVKFFDHSFGN